MAHIPTEVIDRKLEIKLKTHGYELKNRGKVRDTYSIPGNDDKLLVFASNRISIFDFVLPAVVVRKGEVLVALTVFWLKEIFRHYPNHLIAFGKGVEPYVPEIVACNPSWMPRLLVVNKLDMIPVECIVREFLTGSGLDAYQKQGHICDNVLPPGLREGSRLPGPIFTPTTKADVGHDEHWAAQKVVETFGHRISEMSIAVHTTASLYAKQRGIIIADTKFELGRHSEYGVMLADEILTPDSSRFWYVDEYEAAMSEGRPARPHDKQLVREWGKGLETPWGKGIHKLNPQIPEHLEFVDSIDVPRKVLEETTAVYEGIFEGLTGKTLGVFQREVMGM